MRTRGWQDFSSEPEHPAQNDAARIAAVEFFRTSRLLFVSESCYLLSTAPRSRGKWTRTVSFTVIRPVTS